jgi:hypothetical protein
VAVGVGVIPAAASTTDSKRAIHWARDCGEQLVKSNNASSAAIPKKAVFFIRFLATIPLSIGIYLTTKKRDLFGTLSFLAGRARPVAFAAKAAL